jgi:lipopolysaccharide transport system ATP-binding protein
LTGRENVYLNGALLGMTKEEIRRKFDEIVAFSDVGNFIDTPVKRYSSGMYVRLAFAIAAHLEPEILVVDEVLAVGDAQFQKKCLGKMEEVGKEGRTVLFVSHNMPSLQSLCNKAIYLKDGKMFKEGNTSLVIGEYLSGNSNNDDDIVDVSLFTRSAGKGNVIKKAWIEDARGNVTRQLLMGDGIKVCFEFSYIDVINSPVFGFGFEDVNAQRIFSLNNYVIESSTIGKISSGIAECFVPKLPLQPGTYKLSLSIVQNQNEWIDFIERAISFTVSPGDVYNTGKLFDKTQGVIYVQGSVTIRNHA